MRNGDVLVFDVLKGTQESITPLQGEATGVLALGSRTRFAAVTSNGVQVRDSEGPLEVVIPIAPDMISFVLFDQAAERLAVANDDGLVTLWDAVTATKVDELLFAVRDDGSAVLPGPGFTLLYPLGPDKVRIRSIGSRGVDTVIEFSQNPAIELSLAANGRFLAVLYRDGTVEIRGLPAGTVQATLGGFETPPRTMALSPDGSVLALDVDGKSVELWDTAANERIDRAESELWSDGGISFSPQGYVLAWVHKSRHEARFWSPTRGVVQWMSDGPVVEETARSACPDLASMIRFRRAAAPFARGTGLFKANKLAQARAAFAEAQKIFPAYPGLAVAAAEVEERYQANRNSEEVLQHAEKLEAAAEYYEALSLLDAFLRDFPAYGDEHRERAQRIRTMLQHFELAQAHREAGRTLEAVKEFRKAAAIYPTLAEKHPEYRALPEQLVDALEAEAQAALEAQDHKKLVEVYSDLAQLRPLDTQEWLRAGDANEKLGLRQRAQEAYLSIPDQTPEYAEARRNLARLARANGKLETAKEELERARNAAPRNIALATEYAELCEALKDLDGAVLAWNRVGELDPGSPKPFEIIGAIEEKRERWDEAAKVYRKCIRRSTQPRPDLLLKIAEVYGRLDNKEKILEAYVDLFELAQSQPALPLLGKKPKQKVLKWIRDLGYVRHRGEWIPKEQFYAEQGWIHYAHETWIRPEEARLREIVQRFEKRADENLRTLDSERYQSEAAAKRISRGMNRREVIQAWGFFEDQNVFKLEAGNVVFEQLLFSNGRQVYLRNGLVCFWSE